MPLVTLSPDLLDPRHSWADRVAALAIRAALYQCLLAAEPLAAL